MTTPDPGQVPDAILSATQNPQLAASMLMGSALEGGWNSPYPVGDSGTSFGPYQLHQGGLLTSLGLTQAQANDATAATNAMLPVYQKALSSVSSSLWSSNPEQAAEQVAVKAESPAQDYVTSQGQTAVDTAWTNTAQVMNNAGQNASTTSSLLGSLFGISLNNILGFNPANLKSDAERVALVLFGGLLVLIGIVIFAAPAAKTAAEGYIGARTLGLAATGAQSKARQADQERRQGIANRSFALGERKQALKEKREARLSRTASARLPENRGVAR